MRCPLLHPCMQPSQHAPPTTAALHPCCTLHTAFLPCLAYYSVSTRNLSLAPCPLLNPCMGLSHPALPITESLYSKFLLCSASRVSLHWEFPPCHTIPLCPYKAYHCASKHVGVLILSIPTILMYSYSVPTVSCPPPSPSFLSASFPCYHINGAFPVTLGIQEVSPFSR